MRFVLNYNAGYEVGVEMVGELGTLTTLPLRNFGHRQGDAKVFQMEDCPKLTETELKSLIKRYDPTVKYKRINGRSFAKDHEDYR